MSTTRDKLCRQALGVLPRVAVCRALWPASQERGCVCTDGIPRQKHVFKFPLVRSRVESHRYRFYIPQLCWTLQVEDVIKCAGFGAISAREIESYGGKGFSHSGRAGELIRLRRSGVSCRTAGCLKMTTRKIVWVRGALHMHLHSPMAQVGRRVVES